jgi:hypothetical protein
MTQLDSIIFHELPMVHQIINDETWLEGERRGCAVFSTDQVVRKNVCSVVLRIGAQMRESTRKVMAGAPVMRVCPVAPEAA